MRWKVQSLAMLAIISGAGSVAAQEVDAPPPEGAFYDAAGDRLSGRETRWLNRPTVGARDFPEPLMSRSGGVWYAVVACTAEADGRLTGCRAERESEPGLRVGRSAVSIVRRGRLTAPVEPDASGAQPTVRVTITFHVH